MDNVPTVESLLELLDRELTDAHYCQVPIPNQFAWGMGVGAGMVVHVCSGAVCMFGSFSEWPTWRVNVFGALPMLMSSGFVLLAAHKQQQTQWRHWRKRSGWPIRNASEFRDLLRWRKARDIHKRWKSSRHWNRDTIARLRDEVQADLNKRLAWAVGLVGLLATALGILSGLYGFLLGPLLEQMGAASLLVIFVGALLLARVVRSMWYDAFDRRSRTLKELYHVLGNCDGKLASKSKRYFRSPKVAEAI